KPGGPAHRAAQSARTVAAGSPSRRGRSLAQSMPTPGGPVRRAWRKALGCHALALVPLALDALVRGPLGQCACFWWGFTPACLGGWVAVLGRLMEACRRGWAADFAGFTGG